MYSLLILMNDWIAYVEDWFNQSSIVFADDEFDRMAKELVRGFDNLTDEFDRIFSNDSKEFGFSESYFRVGSKIVRDRQGNKSKKNHKKCQTCIRTARCSTLHGPYFPVFLILYMYISTSGNLPTSIR
jgi:hypothetical protein